MPNSSKNAIKKERYADVYLYRFYTIYINFKKKNNYEILLSNDGLRSGYLVTTLTPPAKISSD